MDIVTAIDFQIIKCCLFGSEDVRKDFRGDVTHGRDQTLMNCGMPTKGPAFLPELLQDSLQSDSELR